MTHDGHHKLMFELSTRRLEALSDGVFAIAMTILVLNFDINIHGDKASEIYAKLSNQWSDFMHYVQSFLVLSFFWIKHHQQYHFIRKTDLTILWLNIVSLMFVCLIPYSTSIVSDYGHLRIGAIIFESNMLVVGLIFFWKWRYATKGKRLVEADISEGLIKAINKMNLIVPVVSVVAIIISIFLPRVGTSLYFILPVFSFIKSKVKRRS